MALHPNLSDNQINTLDDVDVPTLQALIKRALADTKKLNKG